MIKKVKNNNQCKHFKGQGEYLWEIYDRKYDQKLYARPGIVNLVSYIFKTYRRDLKRKLV